MHSDQIQSIFWRMQMTLLVRWINIMGESIPFRYLLVLASYLGIFLFFLNFHHQFQLLPDLIGTEIGKSNFLLTLRKKNLTVKNICSLKTPLYLLCLQNTLGISFQWERLKICFPFPLQMHKASSACRIFTFT